MMITTVNVVPKLDDLLENICDTLRITPSQFREAEGHYRAVGEWLDDDQSPIHHLKPRIYPQGSMALRTTVRPRGQEEFDVDLVLQVTPDSVDPFGLYELVASRLEESGVYAPRLERKKRCLRLDYSGQFHLDILPATDDYSRGGTCILVPDHKERAWSPSNPLGYRGWFEDQASEGVLSERTRGQDALPHPQKMISVLQQSVQLVKRRRDNYFRGDDLAPRSVVLTTLVAQVYHGEASVATAVAGALARIDAMTASSASSRLEVANPTNPDEEFSEAWSDPKAYRAFLDFLATFRAEVQNLSAAKGGLPQIGQMLDDMFGDSLGSLAVRSLGARSAQAKDAGLLVYPAGQQADAVPESRRTARHTFHHGT